MLIHFLEIIKDNNKNNVKDKEVEIKNENLNDLEINKEENIETKVINKEIKINKKVYFCDICKKNTKIINVYGVTLKSFIKNQIL